MGVLTTIPHLLILFLCVSWKEVATQQFGYGIAPSPSLSAQKSKHSSGLARTCYDVWTTRPRCHSGECIYDHDVCDGYPNCYDGSDEWYCPNSRTPDIQKTSDSWLQTPVISPDPVSTTSHSATISCSLGQFKCPIQGGCIPRYWLCDGINDCHPVPVDEHSSNCYPDSTSIAPTSTALPPVSSALPSCNYWQFQCKSGQCIDRYWLCDGTYHCWDGSDEQTSMCAGRWSSDAVHSTVVSVSKSASSSVSSSCSDGQFKCNSGKCIPSSWICDGDNDCGDWVDERVGGCGLWPAVTSSSQVLASSSVAFGCSYYYQFRCSSGQCISDYNVCNGHIDCWDGSDERPDICGFPVTSHIQSSPVLTSSVHVVSSSCSYGQFKCRNGRCIPNSYLCDGDNDCGDWVDEQWQNCASRNPIRSSIEPTPSVSAVLATSSVQVCPDYKPFQCGNGQCIEEYKVCDGYVNCWDESDEGSNCKAHNATKCKNNVDIGFILDSSSSVGYDNFWRMKKFVKDVTDAFKISFGGSRVSVMSFSDNAYIHIRFSQYFNKQSFDYAVDSIYYRGGGTATAMALNTALNDMFTSHNGARGSGTKKVLIIVTDGRSNSGQVSGPARQLKNKGVVILSLGIGQSISEQELHEMASQPTSRHVFQIDNFVELTSLAKNISEKICRANHIVVLCDNDYMTAIFDRRDLPKNINVNHLYLRDERCRATYNSTHVTVRAPLTGCGTVYEEDEQTMSFSNVLSESHYYSGTGIITRDHLFTANLTCCYGRKRRVGSLSFEPCRQRYPVSLKGEGNFTLAFDFYKNNSFNDVYTSYDYPVFKELSENIYIQYSIVTSNKDLVIHAQTCRATPSNRPYDYPQYVFIANGCDNDGTILHYDQGMSNVKRFSIQAFRFFAQHRFVYIHCDLVVCNRNHNDSICARGDRCSHRARRDVDHQMSSADDSSRMYALSFGPAMYSRSADKERTSDKQNSNVEFTMTGSLIGVACVAVLLAGALIFVLKRRPVLPKRDVQGVTNNVAMDEIKA